MYSRASFVRSAKQKQPHKLPLNNNLLSNNIYRPPATSKVMSNHNSCCANCGKPASLRCGRCAEGLDIHGIKSSTFYCDAVCQKAHWKEAHKAECKHANYRKQLYRAGLTIHELYYFTRLEAFDLKATKAEKQNGILCVEQGDYGENEILVDFPESIFTEDNDKFAMLAWNSCGEALARMHDIASAALEGNTCIDPSGPGEGILADR